MFTGTMSIHAAAFALLCMTGMTGCAGKAASPPPAPPPPAPAQAPPPANRHDVAFTQAMIAHHGQALTLAKLVPDRSGEQGMRMLAERIEITQLGEIARMKQWLAARGIAAPDSTLHQHAHMPGMISAEELSRLAAASGRDFDALFLELMIRHHEGALVMVRDLFASEGAVQDPGLFMLASDIDADQRAEIARMRRLLDTLQRGSE